MNNGANHNWMAADTKLAGRFCQTPIKGMASDTDALQFSNRRTSSVRHIYVHIPFCARICPYCAFYKDLLDRSQTSRFCEALLQELIGRERPPSPRLRRAGRARCLVPSTIYFGGGTPTALNIAQLDLLLHGFHETFDLSRL